MATQHAALRLQPTTPRRRAASDAFIRPVIRSLERFAWAQAIFLACVALLTCVIVMGRDIASNADAAYAAVIALGVLPGWLLSRLILGDATLVRDLAQYGLVSRAKLVGVRRPWRFFLPTYWLARSRWWAPVLWTRARLVRVEWIENGTRRQGEVILDAWLAPADAEDIRVITCPGMHRIAIVLGGQRMVVGTRS